MSSVKTFKGLSKRKICVHKLKLYPVSPSAEILAKTAASPFIFAGI